MNVDKGDGSNVGHILLVEDSVANQAIASAYLKKDGYAVDAVTDGNEALTAITKRNYDLVLMDLAMPFMDGFEATRRIRKLPGDVSQVPIIAITAHAMPGGKEACLLAGMNDYLSKPLNKTILLTKISQWISSSSSNNNLKNNAIVRQDDKSYIDHDVLKQLEKDTSADIALDIIKIFVAETDKRLSQIKEACRKSDYSVLQKEAHVLKSSAGIYGALKLQQLAIKVDAACKENRGQDAIEIALNLVQAGVESLTLLTEYVAKSSATD